MNIINLKKFQASIYKSILDEKTYWIESVTHAYEVYDLTKKIPNDILELIKNGDIYLVISNEFECFIDVPEAVYTHLIISSNIPEHKIVFLSGAKNITILCDEIVKKINLETNSDYKGMITKFFPWYENLISSTIRHNTTLEFKRNLALNGKIDYKKHFLLLNRRWRLHRPVLVALLKSKNLLDYGYVSLGYNDQNYTWENVYQDMLDYNKDNEDLYDILIKNKTDILSLSNLCVDTDDFDDKTVPISLSLQKYYETSFCSIVTETYFYDSGTYFLTEKAIKPIAHKHPFILVSTPHSLDFLHELGYKTFHPIFDESYDKETSDSKRMHKILTLIESICKLNQSELREISLDCKEICNYNYKKLLSKNV